MTLPLLSLLRRRRCWRRRDEALTSSILVDKECAQAFFILQSHHDYCPHDTLTRYEEELFHEWESKCIGCNIVRQYNANLNACPVIDCTDTTVASLGYDYLAGSCVKADFSYAFEWAAVFDTPTPTSGAYTWVAQVCGVASALLALALSLTACSPGKTLSASARLP